MSQEPSSPYETPQTTMSAAEGHNAHPASSSAVPKVLGILNIIFACIGGIVAIIGIAASFAAKAMFEKMDETGEIAVAYDGLMGYAYLELALKVILTIMLLMGGIGLLKRKLWGRKSTMIWAIARIVVGIAMFVITMGAQKEFQDAVSGMQGQGTDVQQTAQAVGGAFGILLICAYPIICLILLSRPNVKNSLS